MSFSSSTETAEHVSRCLELAILLEVSAYPKPGNVHRTADFQETRYEHFLASAVAVAPHFKHAAEQGIKVSEGKINPTDVGIGTIIKDAVKSVSLWQSDGNTLLGAIILLSPIAVAAGMLAEEKFSPSKLRKTMKVIVESSTPMDAVNVYDAIQIAKPSGLGKAPKLDVTDPASKQKILDEHVTLLEVFKIASAYDSIASEWVNNYPITFDLGHPYFTQQLKETTDVNTATVHAFLKILSEVPDTFISRKVGLAKAKRISAEAGRVLEKGGLTTPSGRNLLRKFDKKLKDPAHRLSPGTTADITEAVLAISILNGYRP
ncbi:MAG: triphosphoribosyl-dephospho-CoA synthase [Candidatus Bathyarchaeota archaeon]|nr:triphosphoribosyl-dephospho-CoA synthase [Candidatus Bathyarchaeota archaeon]